MIWSTQVTGWGLCPAGLQSPHQGHPLAGSRPRGGGVPLPHLCLCSLIAAAVCLGHRLRDLASSVWVAWGAGGLVGLGAWLPQRWLLGRIWGPDPEGAANWDLLPLSHDLDLRRWQLCLGTWPFLIRSGNNIYLVKIYRNILTWPWPDLKNKGFDTKFAPANHTPPSPFLQKGFTESSGAFGVFMAWATHFLAWPCDKHFSVPDSNVLVSFGLTVSGTWTCISVTFSGC